MLPEEMPPPGLAEMFSGPPDTIQVNQGGMEPEPEEEPMTDEDLIRSAIESLQEAMGNEADDANSAGLAEIITKLYKLTSGQQDAAIQAMGGQPKQTRALQKAYGG